MQNLRNKLIALAAVGTLAAVGSLMNSSKVAAQGPPGGMSVNIVNPLPVPVTGSTTVSGSVAATQSGAWSVGISGTPGVNANINPNGAIPSVNATNSKDSSGNPVPLVTQIGSASSVFNVTGACSGFGGGLCRTQTMFSVQPNQIAVLDSVSGVCQLNNNDGVAEIHVDGDNLAEQAFVSPGPVVREPGLIIAVSFSQNLTAYLVSRLSGTNYSLVFFDTAGGGGGTCTAQVSGHYLAQ